MNKGLQHIDPKKSYLLAVSGGVDSMVMLHLFLHLGVSFQVAHCNFQLREHDAHLDELLVREWCENNDIILHVKSIDTHRFATENNLSIQVAARNIRYEFFAEICETNNLDFIATAHHEDDNIETLLFNFSRGTGMHGLTGIPIKNGNIVRPLLHFAKQEIIEYAKQHQIIYREDSSNLKQDYTRNKLRLDIIPKMQEIFPGYRHNLLANINRFKEMEVIYDKQIQLYKKKLLEKRGLDYYIPILKLRHIKPLDTILFEILRGFNFSYEQAQEALKIMHAESGRYIENQSHRLIKDRNFFIITNKNANATDRIEISMADKEVITQDFVLQIERKQFSEYALKKELTICIVDAKLLEEPLVLRKWKPGDYLYPFGMMKKKKVARVLIDAKIPLHQKERIWVLESNKKIIWIVGIKTDNRFRMTEKTKEVCIYTIKNLH